MAPPRGAAAGLWSQSRHRPFPLFPAQGWSTNSPRKVPPSCQPVQPAPRIAPPPRRGKVQRTASTVKPPPKTTGPPSPGPQRCRSRDCSSCSGLSRSRPGRGSRRVLPQPPPPRSFGGFPRQEEQRVPLHDRERRQQGPMPSRWARGDRSCTSHGPQN